MPGTPEPPRHETVIAFDFGLRRIGVAVGQTVTGSASPLGTVRNSDAGPDHERIATILEDWHPARLIVGMPSHADGAPSAIERRVRAFVAELGRYGLPVDTVDERLTSVEAQDTLRRARADGQRGRVSREDIDAAAAVLIAERYLASQHG